MKTANRIYFLAILMLACIISDLQAQYRVYGTGNTDIDGIYYEEGSYNNYPMFTNGSSYLFYRGCDMKWIISNNPGNCATYSTPIDGDVPTTDGWVMGGGYQKVPENNFIISKMNGIGFNKKVIAESAKDDGSVTDSIQILLYTIENPFTGNNGDDFVADGKVLISNVPSGLTAIVERKSDSTLVMKFAGTAANHTPDDNVYNISLAFQNSAFADRDAAEIENSSIDSIGIMFTEKYLVYGDMVNYIGNDTFYLVGLSRNSRWYSNGLCTMYNKDCSYGAKWVITYGYGSCPEYSTFENGDYPDVSGWVNDGGGAGTSVVHVSRFNSIAYDRTSMIESTANNGTVNDSIILRFVVPSDSNVFTGINGDDFVAGGKITVQNLPTGLTAVAVRTSDTSLVLKLTGAAVDHSVAYSIDNLTFEFQDNAFKNGDASLVINYQCNISLVFIQKYEVMGATSYPGVNGTYIPTGFKNGHLIFAKEEYRIGYRGCNFKWVIVNGDDDNRVNGRSGYCPLYRHYSDLETIPEKDWYTGEPLVIMPHNMLLYSKTDFIESSADNGSIDMGDTMVIRYFFPEGGATFTGSNGDNFVADGKITVTNLPAGLTAVITRTSDTTLRVIITGSAVNHNPVDNIKDLTFTFQDGAFSHGDASSVINYMKDNLVLDYFERYEVLGALYYPALKGTYVSAGHINDHVFYAMGEYRIGYRGCNRKWVIVDGDDENNILSHINYCPEYYNENDSDLPPVTTWYPFDNMVVYPHNSLYYSKSSFVESSTNDGSIDHSDTLVIRYFFPSGGASFTGSNGDNFVADAKVTVSNLPAGLTAVVTRTSDTTLTVLLTGSAVNHRIENSIDSLTFEFRDAAFSHGNASSVRYHSKNDISLVFLQKYEVMGATVSPLVNGTYTSAGFINGHVLYSNGEYRLGYRGCSVKWVIVGGDNDNNIMPGINYCPYYDNENDYETPPLSGWEDEPIIVIPHNSLYYSKTIFNESSAGNGSIDNNDTLIIRYLFPEGGAIFSGANGDDFVAGGKITVTNLPAGLNVVANRTSDTTLTVVLTGKTTSGDVYNLTFQFLDAAFTGMQASRVYYSMRNDLELDFHNVYYVISTGGDFATITEAVYSRKVKDGDVLILAAETFTEYNINVNKSLTMKGQGAGKTIVQAAATPGTADARIFYLNSNSNYFDVTIQNMTLQNGSINNYGGCIYSNYCNLTIKDCEIKDNQISSYRGGAIYAYYGNHYYENTTFSNNAVTITSTSTSYGGGAIHFRTYNDTAHISNCTFVGNSASGTHGGAIYFYGNLRVVNTTISDNHAYRGGGIYLNAGYTKNMTNALIAFDTASNYSNDIYGTVNANYCIIYDVTGATINGSNNITGIDPYLSALGDNGGTTRTCAISSTSPARDAGTSINVPLTDQRGVPMYNDTMDIGSYEYNSQPFIMVSESDLDFGNVEVNDTVEQNYSVSAINLTNDLIVTAPTGFEVSGYSGPAFAGSATMTLDPSDGFISDTSIYVRYIPITYGVVEDIITNTSSDTVTANVAVSAAAVVKPTGDDDSLMILVNTENYFSPVTFTYNDEDGGIFAGIKIISKETNGDLEYDGINIVNGNMCEDLSKLLFKPYEDEYGYDYSFFTFKVKDHTGLYSDSVYNMSIDVNDIPVGGNGSVTMDENEEYAFSRGRFTFTDSVGNFGGIRVVSVETAGALEYNGTNVTVGTECNNVTLLTFTPDPDEFGDLYATFGFRVKDDLDAYSVASYVMTINVREVIGIPEIENAMEHIQIYPNPTNGRIVVTIESLNSEVDMVIADIVGRIVIERTLQNNKTEIDLSGLAKGTYSVQFKNEEKGSVIRKIVIE